MNPRCGGALTIHSVVGRRCNETSCDESSECRTTRLGYSRKACFCKEGFIYADNKCRKVTYAKVLEKCYVAELAAYGCDINEHSFCSKGKCICFESFYPNTTSGKCEPLADFLKSVNLTEYRVRPNDYCREDSNCITGLKCQDYKCRCPSPCTYNKELEICDCGIIEWPNVTGPIIVGLILGLIILVFWAFMVKRTIKKYAEKEASMFSNIALEAESPMDTGSYALSPITSPDIPSSAPVGLSLPTNTSPRPDSFVPYKPEDDTSNGFSPPSASMYGLNPSSSAPSAPSTYSVTNSVVDQPPPYSLNPLPMDNAATSGPYATNTGDLPYPTNPDISNLSSISPGEPPYPTKKYNLSTDM